MSYSSTHDSDASALMTTARGVILLSLFTDKEQNALESNEAVKMNVIMQTRLYDYQKDTCDEYEQRGDTPYTTLGYTRFAKSLSEDGLNK